MLGKLIQYDIKNIGKMTGFAYIILAVLSILVLVAQGFYRHFSSNLAVKWFYGGMYVAFYAGIVLACVLLIVVIIEYILKNIFKDEGYLMHTLPVSPGSLMASKLVAAMFWSIIMLITCYFCKAIVSQDMFWIQKLISSITEGKKGGIVVVTAVVLCVVSFYINMMCGIFMAASVGYSYFSKYKSVYVFFLCILVYIINQVTGVLVEIAGVLMKYGSLNALQTATEQEVPLLFVGKMLLCGSAVYLILAGVYSVIAVKRMRSHLNLD